MASGMGPDRTPRVVRQAPMPINVQRRQAENATTHSGKAPHNRLAGEKDGDRSDRMMHWLAEPMTMVVSRAVVVFFGVAMLLTLVMAFWMGRLTTAGQNVQPLAVEATTARTQSAGPAAEVSRAVSDMPPVEQRVYDDPADDPREIGQYYYRLASFPIDFRSRGIEAIEFLRRQGIDAAMLRTHNGEFYILFVLSGPEVPGGFTSEEDEKVRQLRRRLLTLGQVWKRDHNGGRAWNDLYAWPKR